MTSTVQSVPRRSASQFDLVELCAKHPAPFCSGHFHWKQLLDWSLAALMLAPCLPIIGALVLLVRATSRGPGIYSQTRVGRNGRTFTMYKIRTMREDAEVGTGAVWTGTNDPRITRLGCFLRKVHLDELPQLFNVLRGEMSLVGPRPERPEFVYILTEQIPGYTERLAVLPGVTGLAQINLPPDSDLNSVRRKQILDLEYIRTASFLLDLRMLACTSLRLVGIGGALATRLTFVQRPIPRISDDSLVEEDPEHNLDNSSSTCAAPVGLTSAALRETLAQLSETLDDSQCHLQQQVLELLSAESSGNGHSRKIHATDRPHEGNFSPNRCGDDHSQKELRTAKPR